MQDRSRGGAARRPEIERITFDCSLSGATGEKSVASASRRAPGVSQASADPAMRPPLRLVGWRATIRRLCASYSARRLPELRAKTRRCTAGIEAAGRHGGASVVEAAEAAQGGTRAHEIPSSRIVSVQNRGALSRCRGSQRNAVIEVCEYTLFSQSSSGPR